MNNDPFLFADSFITHGMCKAVVCAVGQNSTRGIMDTVYDTREKQTELKSRLDNIGGSLKYIGLLTSILILAISMVIIIINKAAVEDLGADEFMHRIVTAIIISLVMLVVAIPEGLPMTVTVSLAYSVLQMSEDDGVLVREVEAVERVGQITHLVLGKTGTMTTEEMRVHSFYAQSLKRLNSRHDTF